MAVEVSLSAACVDPLLAARSREGSPSGSLAISAWHAAEYSVHPAYSPQLALPNLDAADGKLQEAIVRVLRNRGAFTKAVHNLVRDELGTREEGTLYGLVNESIPPRAPRPLSVDTSRGPE